MNRYLIGFGSDVTKLRAQLLQNFELIPTEEGQEDIKNRVEALPERFYDALIPIMIIGTIVLITPEGRKQVADLFKNIREKYEQNPFDIHYSLVYIPEYLLLLCYPDEKHLALVNDLGHEIKKNELIGMDDNSLAGLKIAAAVDQENRNFPLYFAYTLRQMPTMKVVEFLDHQLMLFKGNFKSFLEGILIEYGEEGMLMEKTKKAVDKWLENNRFSSQLLEKVGDRKSDDLKKKIVLDEFKWLRELASNGEKIIFEKDYIKLLGYMEVLVTENKIPSAVEPITGITHIGFSKKMRFSFYKIHCAMQGNRPVNTKYIDLLHKLFPGNFTGKLENTRTKFSTPAKY